MNTNCSKHEEVILTLRLGDIVANQVGSQSETSNKEEEQGVVEIFLQQVEIVLG